MSLLDYPEQYYNALEDVIGTRIEELEDELLGVEAKQAELVELKAAHDALQTMDGEALIAALAAMGRGEKAKGAEPSPEIEPFHVGHAQD